MRRLTVYGGVSSLPGIIPFLPISIPGVIAATVLETGLQLQEQLSYVMTLLLFRGHRGDDRQLLDEALPYVFHKKKVSPGRAALQNLAGELGESVLEQAFPILGKRAIVRINTRVIIRVIPLIGVAIGAILSMIQAVVMTRSVRHLMNVGRYKEEGHAWRRMVAHAETERERTDPALWGHALTMSDIDSVGDGRVRETKPTPRSQPLVLDVDA